MRLRNRLGIAGFTAVSIGLASLAPQPAREQVKPEHEVVVTDPDMQAKTGETPATRRMANFAAFVLGAIDAEGREKRDPEERFTVEENRGYTSLRLSRVLAGVGCTAAAQECGTVYNIFVTTRRDATGVLDPAAITSVTVHEDRYSGNKGGPVFALDTRPVESGWIADVAMDEDGEGGGNMYSFSGNTGGSIAEAQAIDIIDEAADVVRRATA